MHYIILLLSFYALAIGLFQLACIIFHMPSKNTVAMIYSYDKLKNAKKGIIFEFVMKTAYFVQPRIKIEPFKRNKMLRALQRLEDDTSPELFIGIALGNALITIITLVPFAVVFPPVIFGAVMIAFYQYQNQINSLFIALKKHQDAIESELNNFCHTIRQEISRTRDVPNILKHYAKYAGRSFRLELEKTTADMMSGDHEYALMELDRRVNSNRLGDVIRALTTILHGKDNPYTWDMLCQTFDHFQENDMQKLAAPLPGKINKYNMILVFNAVFLVLAIMILAMFEQVKGIQL